MRAFISYILKRTPDVPVPYLVALVGMGMIAYGIALVAGTPAGLIAGGVFLILATIDAQIDLGPKGEA